MLYFNSTNGYYLIYAGPQGGFLKKYKKYKNIFRRKG